MHDNQRKAMDRLREKGVDVGNLTYMQPRSFYEGAWEEKLPNFIYIEELLNKAEINKKNGE